MKKGKGDDARITTPLELINSRTTLLFKKGVGKGDNSIFVKISICRISSHV